LGVVSLFTLAIFLSATLLFLVQPLVGKILLPVLGGSPAVWSICMVFFQAVLLLGYLYAHALSSRVAPRWQWLVHAGVLLAATMVLPLPVDVGEPGAADPRWWALGVLAGTVGLPFFALSATAPLLQHWFSRTSDRSARDPYFLYAASNAGSLLGLLGYLLVEPFASRSVQAAGWAAGFWAVAVLIAVCAYVPVASGLSRPSTRLGTALSLSKGRKAAAVERIRTPHASFRLKPEATPGKPTLSGAGRHTISWSRRALWVVLALVPSTLLLGVTQHLAADVVSAPLLWVVPLALYLTTFIAVFSGRGFSTARRWGAVAPAAALAVLLLSLSEVRYPILLVALVHLAAFTVLAMLCHTRLAESRPDAAHLTEYFACVSLGGVLGGVAAALVAPVVFTSILEYPLELAAVLFLRPQTLEADRAATSSVRRVAWRVSAALLLVAGYWCVSALNRQGTSSPLTTNASFAWLQSFTSDVTMAIRASLAIPAALLLVTSRTALLFAGMTAGLLVGAGVVRTGGDVLDRERTFFGVHQVTAIQNGDWHVLTHGTTTHGVQAVRGRLRSLPTAYYHPSGPLGDVVFTLVPDGRFRDVAAIGLGAGALAAYAGSGVRMDFFEIDDAVIRIAENPRYFTYLTDARARPGATVRTVAADGRLGLRAMPEASYDLIVVDAFSSDAIPTHLVTREAVAVYESRLKSRGMIAFHVSSRFFDLPPVVARIAADRGLVDYVRNDRDVPKDKAEQAMRPSVWVVLAREERDFGQIAQSAGRWARLAANADDPLWTDDYSNVLGVLAKQP
jgi:hypothetical protein